MTVPAHKEVTGMTPRRTFLGLEPLGDRVLPSATALPMPAAPLTAVLATAQPALHLLQGHGRGSYTADAVQSGAGAAYRLQGTADLAGLGRVTVSGLVHAVGFIQHGHAGGELTFTNGRGSVTVELLGAEQPAFSPLPGAFHYRVVAGTGAYKDLTGEGTLQLALHPGAAGTGGTPHGTFALTI
jgi:hypothetical protein